MSYTKGILKFIQRVKIYWVIFIIQSFICMLKIEKQIKIDTAWNISKWEIFLTKNKYIGKIKIKSVHRNWRTIKRLLLHKILKFYCWIFITSYFEKEVNASIIYYSANIEKRTETSQNLRLISYSSRKTKHWWCSNTKNQIVFQLAFYLTNSNWYQFENEKSFYLSL